jgi:hypothetical protein
MATNTCRSVKWHRQTLENQGFVQKQPFAKRVGFCRNLGRRIFLNATNQALVHNHRPEKPEPKLKSLQVDYRIYVHI